MQEQNGLVCFSVIEEVICLVMFQFLKQIQSPIGAYIHNSPCPVLMTNVKPKTASSTTPRDHEKRHRPVWDNLGPRNHKVLISFLSLYPPL